MRVSILFSLISMFCMRALLFGASPVLYFSDIISGPKNGGKDGNGAIVTVWGKNLGSTQGSSTVFCNGIQAAEVLFWGNATAPADMYTYHKMQMVSFAISPSASDGVGQIYLAVNGANSNALSFTVRDGNIHFVKTTGNDSSGNGSWNDPWQSIVKAKNTMADGDITYICDGVSQTTQEAYNACVNINSIATPSAPRALVAYPGAIVHVGSLSVSRGFHNWISGTSGNRSMYWVIAKIIITPQNGSISCGQGYRVVGNKISTPNGDGASAALEFGKTGVTVLGNELYNCGTANASKLYHNIYVNNHTGVTISNIEIGWNIIRNSTANRAIQVYSDGTGTANIADMMIHDNVIHDVRGNGININQRSAGVFKVFNNILYRCGLGPDPHDGLTSYSALYISSSLNIADVYAYNNTFYDCGNPLYPSGSGFLQVSSSFAGNAYIRNNIIYSTGENHEDYMVSSGGGIVSGDNHNLFFGKGTPPPWDTAALNVDPGFIDLSAENFHLVSGSPCIGGGYNTTAVVARDLDGKLRDPNNVAIGAYEYAAYVAPLYAIRGSVFDAQGAGIADADITLSDGSSQATTTGADGSYAVTSLPENLNYVVTPSKSGFTFTPESSSVAQLSADVHNCDFTGTADDAGDGSGDVGDDATFSGVPVAIVNDIKIIGSAEGKGTINPDKGDTAKIYFDGKGTGKYECRIFTLAGELVWRSSQDNVVDGMFEWTAKDISSGTYIVHVRGPGLNKKKKVIIIR